MIFAGASRPLKSVLLQRQRDGAQVVVGLFLTRRAAEQVEGIYVDAPDPFREKSLETIVYGHLYVAGDGGAAREVLRLLRSQKGWRA